MEIKNKEEIKQDKIHEEEDGQLLPWRWVEKKNYETPNRCLSCNNFRLKVEIIRNSLEIV